MRVAVLVDKVSQDFSRRPGSAWAKNALDNLRVLLVRRNSLTSRSSADVVVPALAPVSTALRLTNSFSLFGTQSILGAMDSRAAHSEGYSPRCSYTMRTRALQEKTCSTSSWLNPLRDLSLHETRAVHLVIFQCVKVEHRQRRSVNFLDAVNLSSRRLSCATKLCGDLTKPQRSHL